MNTMQLGDIRERLTADSGNVTSRRPAKSPCGPHMAKRMRRAQYQQQHHVAAKPQGGVHRIGTYLLGAAVVLAVAVNAPAQEYDPPITPLVSNLLQPPGPDGIATFAGLRDRLYQAFRTGPNPGGYELKSIWLYVRNVHEHGRMTVEAGLYQGTLRGKPRVAALTRGQLKIFALNQWRAPANTFLEPNTRYVFVLDCTAGCATDSGAEIGVTRSPREDPGAEGGWIIEGHFGLRSAGTANWSENATEILRMRIKGRPSPFRAYKAEIISTPAYGDTYRHGENIDIALTFNTVVYVPGNDSTIAIQVGDAAGDLSSRTAEYLFGSGTCLLVYRYRVLMSDAGASGISLGQDQAQSGFGGNIPTSVPASAGCR